MKKLRTLLCRVMFMDCYKVLSKQNRREFHRECVECEEYYAQKTPVETRV